MYTQEKIIQKFNEVHNNKYDYSKVIFNKTTEKVCIICPEHGEFWQEPRCHVKGHGCPYCGKIKRAISKTNKTVDFIKKAEDKHKDKFTYDNVNYVNSVTKVTVTCKKHGNFNIRPDMLLQGHGCPECKKESLSNKNRKYNILLNDVLSFITQNIGDISYEYISPKEVYFPHYSIGIKMLIISEDNENSNPKRTVHQQLNNEYEKNGKQIIQIFEDEWLNKTEICKSRIRNIFGKNNSRIYGRECAIKIIDNKTAKNFCQLNHIQGYVNGKISLGLYYENELVSVMTFGGLRKNLGSIQKEDCYELLRFCNKIGVSVIGSASKMFKYFIKNYNPNEIISYADRRWSVGKIYETLGFKEIRKTEPNYFYIINGERKNRFSFRKDVLISKYGCSKDDTEHNFCKSQGWYRIYDCGCKVFIYKNDK